MAEIKDHTLFQELSMPAVFYRGIMFMQENVSQGNYAAAMNLLDHLETVASPFRDKQYLADIERIGKIQPSTGRSTNERNRNLQRYESIIYKERFSAIMSLAYRQGWLGAKQSRADMSEYSEKELLDG